MTNNTIVPIANEERTATEISPAREAPTGALNRREREVEAMNEPALRQAADTNSRNGKLCLGLGVSCAAIGILSFSGVIPFEALIGGVFLGCAAPSTYLGISGLRLAREQREAIEDIAAERAIAQEVEVELPAHEIGNDASMTATQDHAVDGIPSSSASRAAAYKSVKQYSMER